MRLFAIRAEKTCTKAPPCYRLCTAALHHGQFLTLRRPPICAASGNATVGSAGVPAAANVCRKRRGHRWMGLVVQPEALRGQPVAIVNRDDRGRTLVTRDVQRRRYEGSGGDGERDRHEEDRRDHRDDDHR